MAGKISGKASPRKTRAAQGTLGQAATGGTAPEHSQPLQFHNYLRALRAKRLDGVLITQVIASLDGVKDMSFYAVVLPQDGVKTTLGRPAVGAGGIDFAQYRHITFF